MSSTDQFGELLEAYALGALDAPERAALEAHLATHCKECTAALAEARWLVSQLAYAAPEANPSDMLRGRVMKVAREEAAAEQAADQHGRGEALPAPFTAQRIIPYWMWAAVAALLVVSIYSTWSAQRLSEQMRDVNARAIAELNSRAKIEDELGQLRREATILTDPASVKIPLATGEPHAGPVQATWHSQLGLVVSGQKIAPPPGDRVLQLWLIPKEAGGKPVPSRVVRPDDHGNFVLLVANPPEAMTETKALAITEEPAGGSALPTTTPKWVGGIS